MSIRSVRIARAVALSLLAPTLSLAAGSEQLSEVIVTATAFHGTPDDVLHPVVVLAGDSLQVQRGSTLAETLARQPGITTSWYGPAASRPIIRGLGGDRVMVLEDGLSALDLSSLSEDHATATEDAVAQQVEILKGPATLLYGSGAVGGAVNVVTRRIPMQAPSRGLQGNLDLRGGGAQVERSTVGAVDAALGEDLALHADAHYRASGDLRAPDGTVVNSDSRGGGGSLGFSVLTEGGYAGLSGSASTQNYGIPQPAGSPPGGPRIDMKQARVAVRAAQSLGDGPLQRVAVAAAHNLYEHAELEDDGSVGTQFKQDGTEARLTVDHLLGELKGTTGFQFRSLDFSALGAEAFVPSSLTRNYGLFAFEQYAVGAVTLELGVRGEHQQVTPATPSATTPAYSESGLSGSLGLLWRVAEPVALVINASRSDRHPGATELYANGPHAATGQFVVGNASLGKERASSLDLGLRGVQGLRWELSAYANHFQNYLYLAPTPRFSDGLPVFEYRQADARFTGFEAEATLPLLQQGSRGLDLRLSADYVRGELNDGSALPQLPPLRFGAELLANWGRWNASLSATRHQAQDRIAAYETPTAGYTLLDASIHHRFELGDQGSLLLFINGGNLTDQLARRHSSPLKAIVPLPGRSVSAGLRLAL